MTNRRLLAIVLFFWIISLVYLLVGAVVFSKSAFQGVVLIATSHILLLGKILVCLFYIFPRFWKKTKVLQLIASTFSLMLLFVAIRFLLEEVLFVYYLGFPESSGLNPYFFIYDNFYYSAPGVFIGLIVYLAAKSFEASQQNKKLTESVQQAELNFLKSQLNPHFLYNTLNYMYAIAMPVSDKLSLSILKLSETMRYTLTQHKEGLMPLTEEISFIQNYIELHAIQFAPDFYYEFSVEGEVDQLLFPPLLLVPFVENAIKHGVKEIRTQPLEIRLELSQQQLRFWVSNHIHRRLKDMVGGVGLANVKRRLEILYPNKHTLVIENDSYIFKILLTVNL